MAHAHPARVVHAEVMAAPAAWFEAWYLAVECRGDRCPVGRHWPVGRLLAQRRGEPKIADLVRGLRCAVCGTSPDRVTLVERLPERAGGRVHRLVGRMGRAAAPGRELPRPAGWAGPYHVTRPDGTTWIRTFGVIALAVE